VKTQIEGGGYAYLGLSLANAESYPVLTGEAYSSHPSNVLEEAGLRPGDVLVRIGEADLRGAGTTDLIVRSVAEGRPDGRARVVYERGGKRHETWLSLVPMSTSRDRVATSLVFAASAIFVLLRGRPTPTMHAYVLYAFCLAFAMSFSNSYLFWWVSVVAFTLVVPLQLRFWLLFPDSVAPGGPWSRIWPWLFAPVGPFLAITHEGQIALGQAGMYSLGALGNVATLVVVTRKYRRGDPVVRRQIRWVMIGAYCAMLPVTLAYTLASIDVRLDGLIVNAYWGAAVLPAFLLVSVARFNLFDIDRILSATTSYNILAILLATGALVVAPRVAEAVSGFAGVDPGTGQIVLSLALAAVLIPAHQRLRPQIERLFFKERYALDTGIADLLPTLAQCRDARELTQRVGEALHRLLRPEACVVYAAVGGSYVPVFVEGRAVPPGFAPASPLIASLREVRTALALSAAGRRPDAAPLGPFDRAALETLQTEVVVSVHQQDALVAFLCLGPKRSGDVYTATDLSLLTAVAETVSRELRRFDQDETISKAREMQASLRRYVPGAVAQQLSSGAELVSGEREISVLFVDLRGYIGFAESRRAEEIFSTVNRYTESVSQIVQEHGGSVVEFNGDGMMAVFGAPQALAHKERAAVEAGREIVEAVGLLPVEGGETKLSVGVGIATGEAFVGNIQAVDRMIWSAIGNTTNLAARLQGLTRELDASLVIDGVTRERAEHAAEAFERRPDVPIRGRRDTQDVYALPMRAAS
jgi:class 3 adenylate cyclase